MAPPEVVDFLKSREGFKVNVYPDSLGKATAGMGHLLSPQELATYPIGTPVPLDVINDWASTDSSEAYVAAMGQAQNLGITSTAFIVVLTSVNFQLGTGWSMKFPRLWSAMEAKNWKLAAALCGQEAKWKAETPQRVEDFQNALDAL